MNWDKAGSPPRRYEQVCASESAALNFVIFPATSRISLAACFICKRREGDVTPLIGSAVLASTRNCETTVADHIDICPNKAVQDCDGLAHWFLKSGALIVLFFDQFMVLQEGGAH
jgi:hypothetical protein